MKVNSMSGILDVPASKWVAIAEETIDHYQGLADSAWKINNRASGPVIRIKECLEYVTIWESIKSAGQDGKTFGDLTCPDMQDEMLDAFHEGL